MSKPNDVFAVALSRAEIHEILEATIGKSAGNRDLFNAQLKLRQTVRPPQASNDERVKKWGS